MEKIFPSEIIDQSVERVIADIGRPGVNIYRTVLLLVCLSIFSLFFIRVDIVRTSQGIIRSSTDNIGLSTVTDGRVVLSALQENRTVVAGDTLLIQDTYLPDSRIKTTEGRISDTEDRLDDLSAMISGEKPLKTVRYSEDWNNFTSSAEKYRRETEYSEREYQTALGLYRSGVIPRVEFEKALYLYNQAKAAEEEYRSGILSRWKQLYFEAGRELEQYRLDSHSLLQERKNYYLISPASGSLINCTGIKTGQFLHAGQNLAELSLKETMVAECYVAPKDIAYLRQGMKAVIHIDAYNYREWGSLEGSISWIGNDIIFIDRQPVYRVRLTLAADSLTLPNGSAGAIRKGMTLTVHLVLTGRTLMQLLFDKTEDWLNPNIWH